MVSTKRYYFLHLLTLYPQALDGIVSQVFFFFQKWHSFRAWALAKHG